MERREKQRHLSCGDSDEDLQPDSLTLSSALICTRWRAARSLAGSLTGPGGRGLPPAQPLPGTLGCVWGLRVYTGSPAPAPNLEQTLC